MDTPARCPRGHALNEGTIFCTVCWIRVVPEDPIEAAARLRRRRRTFLGISLLAVTGVVIGSVTGQVLTGSSDGTTVVALPLVASTPASAAPSEATAVVAAPLAATVADPVSAEGNCTVQVRGQDLPCTLVNDRLTFTVCVPAGTQRIRVRTRGSSSEPWQDATYVISLGTGTNCPTNEISAEVAIDATSIDAAKWRIVGRDDQREKLWKSPLIAVND
ncbi:MAG: hypothetical protein NTX29_04435 [Actinobacteria bacterium]|nr:hypothetical protein [Actinomycetota bacterium]